MGRFEGTAVVSAALLALVACSSGEAAPRGPSEPFRVRVPPDVTKPLSLDLGGESLLAPFVPGPLPGGLPSDGGIEDGCAKDPRELCISELSLGTRIIYQGSSDLGQSPLIHGDATADTWAVGVRLADVGSGYWVVPTDQIDSQTKARDLTWAAPSDFSPDIPAGYHWLEVAAFDELGNVGSLRRQQLCITPRVPDGLTTCEPDNPKLKPPAAVISMTWDSNVDLDLQVRTPDGTVVDPKHPCSLPLDSNQECPADAGRLDLDSNKNCAIDGVRVENIVWQSTKPHGTFHIHANLYNACGLPATRFTASVWTAVDDGSGGLELVKQWERSGALLATQQNAGSAIGLFISDFIFK